MSNSASKSADGLPLPTIAVTSGEPAGIGPDICLRLAERTWPARLVVLGDSELLVARAAQLGLDAGRIEIRHIPLQKSAPAGRLDPPTRATCSTCSMPRWPAASAASMRRW
jgi:4-hydroxy-L-threonine phosphate dehydrogenase PdxA